MVSMPARLLRVKLAPNAQSSEQAKTAATASSPSADLKDALPQVNTPTPAKPSTMPNVRQRPSLSVLPKCASSAANKGAVAFSTASMPAVRCCAA